MKKNNEITYILVLAVILVTITTNVFATDINIKDLNGSSTVDFTQSGLTAKANDVIALIRNVAIIASVIILMILGVKYMLGSVEEKADYKKSFVPLIIGIVIVVAATSIASFIFSIAQ